MDLLASLIASLSEVIGVHTTALHLSSALGVPTTTLVHRGSGWRYSGVDLIWYAPTTKLWRKKSGESWRDCVERLAHVRSNGRSEEGCREIVLASKPAQDEVRAKYGKPPIDVDAEVARLMRE